jgi:hypothetical protein
VPLKGKSTFFGHGHTDWPPLSLKGNEFYWSFSIHAGADWGFSAVAEGEVYGLGDTDQLCREILLAGGVEPLIGIFSFSFLHSWTVSYGIWRT